MAKLNDGLFLLLWVAAVLVVAAGYAVFIRYGGEQWLMM
jgi:hypothetical protein